MENKGYQKLSDYEEFAILDTVVETPSVYLKEINFVGMFMKLPVQLSRSQLYLAFYNAIIYPTRK